MDSGEQNAGAARPSSTCGTPRGRRALAATLLCGADGDAGLGVGPPPRCGGAVAPRWALPAQLSTTLLNFEGSVQNVNLRLSKGERSARCILTAKYVGNAAWQRLPAGGGGRGCSPVLAASVCPTSSWGRASRERCSAKAVSLSSSILLSSGERGDG